jgi:hypothetical protein
LVVDATGDVTINVLANAHAYIYGIRQLDKTTGIWYSIYPEGQQGECTVNGACEVDFGIQNNGDAPGTLYCKVTRLDTGQVLLDQQFALGVGYTATQIINFAMPLNNVTLRFEIGHL